MRRDFGTAAPLLLLFTAVPLAHSFSIPPSCATRRLEIDQAWTRPLSALHSTASPVDDTVQLLESKLLVLEQVVKELDSRHKREKIQFQKEIDLQKKKQDAMRNDHDQEFATLEAKYQEQLKNAKQEADSSRKQASAASRNIEDLEFKLQAMERDLSQTIEELTDKITEYKKNQKKVDASSDEAVRKATAEYENQIKNLKNELQDVKESAAALQKSKDKQNQILEEEIAALEDRLANKENESRKTIQNLESRLESFADLEDELKSKDEQLEALRTQLSSLEEKSSEYDERMQIATAAVSASEEREKSAQEKLMALIQREKQMAMQLRIQDMTIRKYEEVQNEQDEEIERLTAKLREGGTTIELEPDVDDRDPSLFSRGPSKKGLWSRIRNRAKLD